MNDFFTELDSDLLGAKAPVPPPRVSPPDNRTKNTRPEIGHIIPPTPHTSGPKKQVLQKKDREKAPSDTVSNHVTEMRTQMMKAGVIALVFKVDEKSQALLGHIKLESRGFAFLDEVRELHKIVIKKARASYEDTIKDVPDIEEKDLIKIIRRDMELFLQNKIERIPVIIPMIISV